jgi:outer membrane receptor for ferric coprogen and ferric-rhodotorulic acid
MDPQNTTKYKGFDVVHLRAGYKWKSFEVWVNVMNVADSYYSYITSKTASGYSYTPAEPRHFNMGIAYDFGNLFNAGK